MNHSQHHLGSRHSADFGAAAAAAADCVAPEVVVAPFVFVCERLAVAERPKEGYGPSGIPGRHGARLVPASAGISIVVLDRWTRTRQKGKHVT